MERREVINAILGTFDHGSYLEIGVRKGATFHQVIADRKVAVDPFFQVDHRDDGEYLEITSDAYFGRTDERFDVIFLDGMHTFEQTLRDLLNAVERLKRGGAIVIDDTRPNSYFASFRDERTSQLVKKALDVDDGGAWMGDVYRLLFFIESFMQSFSYAEVMESRGALVLWRQNRPSVPERLVETVARMGYSDTVLASASYSTAPLASIIDRLAQARQRRADS